MAFAFVSSLPKNIQEQDKRDLCSSFECDIDTIKGYLTEIANTYLLVAYRIYEINRYCSYKGKYKNIVEACQAELGFKKSTTYNMINIVEKFGKPDTSGFISYQSLFGVEKFSYSQLCEMLSLSDKQRLKVTPDMTIKEIREIKKTETVIDIVPEPVSAPEQLPDPEPVPISEPVPVPDSDSFQTSGNSDTCFDKGYEDFDFSCSACSFLFDFSSYYGTEDDYKFKDDHIGFRFCPHCGRRIVYNDDKE